MRQKMTIFKEENSVCSGTKFSKITKWRDFLDGHKMALTTKNLKLKNKTCQYRRYTGGATTGGPNPGPVKFQIS